MLLRSSLDESSSALLLSSSPGASLEEDLSLLAGGGKTASSSEELSLSFGEFLASEVKQINCLNMKSIGTMRNVR